MVHPVGPVGQLVFFARLAKVAIIFHPGGGVAGPEPGVTRRGRREGDRDRVLPTVVADVDRPGRVAELGAVDPVAQEMAVLGVEVAGIGLVAVVTEPGDVLDPVPVVVFTVKVIGGAEPG